MQITKRIYDDSKNKVTKLTGADGAIMDILGYKLNFTPVYNTDKRKFRRSSSLGK